MARRTVVATLKKREKSLPLAYVDKQGNVRHFRRGQKKGKHKILAKKVLSKALLKERKDLKSIFFVKGTKVFKAKSGLGKKRRKRKVKARARKARKPKRRKRKWSTKAKGRAKKVRKLRKKLGFKRGAVKKMHTKATRRAMATLKYYGKKRGKKTAKATKKIAAAKKVLKARGFRTSPVKR